MYTCGGEGKERGYYMVILVCVVEEGEGGTTW